MERGWSKRGVGVGKRLAEGVKKSGAVGLERGLKILWITLIQGNNNSADSGLIQTFAKISEPQLDLDFNTHKYLTFLHHQFAKKTVTRVKNWFSTLFYMFA